jgi:hypothetical protein
MLTISTFYGITIRMHWGDHGPPHFHAEVGGARAEFRLEDLAVLRGQLPPTAQRLILQWAELHQQELREDWELCAKGETPRKIPPLE